MLPRALIFIYVSLTSVSVCAGEIQDAYFKRRDVNDFRTLGDYKIEEIGLERTSCYGSCPAYTIKMKADGSIVYSGGEHAKVQGVKSASIDEETFTKIASFIKQIGYVYMSDSFNSPVSDNSTTYTYIKFNGQFKYIRNYANSGPIALWAVEQLIDKQIDRMVLQGER